MHEFSVAQSIVNTVIDLADKHKASQIMEVNLVVGEVALVNMDQLKWHIDMITKDTIAEGVRISATHSPAMIRCEACGYEGGVKYRGEVSDQHSSVPSFECPECDSSDTVIVSGKELHIKDMNVKFNEDEKQEVTKENA